MRVLQPPVRLLRSFRSVPPCSREASSGVNPVCRDLFINPALYDCSR
jgi:hypothetical protein